MGVLIYCEWRTEHEVEPPDGMTDEEFRAALENETMGGAMWDHALEGTNSQIADLINWELAGK